MAFVPKKSGEWELRYPKKTASTTFVSGSAMDWPASPTGYVVKATSTTTKFAGISQRTVLSTDSDYASNTRIPVLFPLVPAAILVATTSGAVETAVVGLRCDLTDDVTVNVGASSVGRVIVDEFYSATSVGVHFLQPAETGAS